MRIRSLLLALCRILALFDLFALPCAVCLQWSTVQLLSEMSRHKWGLTHAEVGDLPFHLHDTRASPASGGGSGGGSGPVEALPADFGGEQSSSALWDACWREREPACSPPPPTRTEGEEGEETSPAGARGGMGDAPSAAEEEGEAHGEAVDEEGESLDDEGLSARERAFLAERRAAVEGPGPEGDPMPQALDARVDALVAERQAEARRFVPRGRPDGDAS